MNAPLAARFPLEVLHDIGDVNFAAIDASLLERSIENCTRRPHKRAAFKIFFVSRLLAHKHHVRSSRSFAEDSLCAAKPEIACFTASGDLAQLLEIRAWWDEFGGSIDLEQSRHSVTFPKLPRAH